MNSKVVIITGASSGIGRAMAEALADKGYRVHGFCRSAAAYPKPENYSLWSMDVTNPEQIDHMFSDIAKKEGQIDIVINNAGRGITGPIETTPLEEIQAIFDVNLYGPIRVIQHALPHMRSSGGGLIVNIGSIGGYMGLPFRGIYSATKSALGIVTEALRLECAEFGIQCCTIDPGDFATDIGKRRYYTPNSPDSPYYSTYGRMLEQIDDHVASGSPPNQLAEALLNILLKEHPKPHYPIGKPLQKLSIRLKGWLPSKLYEGLLKKHYKL